MRELVEGLLLLMIDRIPDRVRLCAHVLRISSGISGGLRSKTGW